MDEARSRCQSVRRARDVNVDSRDGPRPDLRSKPPVTFQQPAHGWRAWTTVSPAWGRYRRRSSLVDTLFGNDRCETRLPKFHIGVLSNVLIDEQGMPLRWTSALALWAVNKKLLISRRAGVRREKRHDVARNQAFLPDAAGDGRCRGRGKGKEGPPPTETVCVCPRALASRI